MEYPTNKHEWWEYLNTHWDDILDFAAQIGINLGCYIWYDGTVMDHTVIEEMNRLKKEQDPKMLITMERIWAHAPDKKWIHSYPGFHYICNLCSEGAYCLKGVQT